MPPAASLPEGRAAGSISTIAEKLPSSGAGYACIYKKKEKERRRSASSVHAAGGEGRGHVFPWHFAGAAAASLPRAPSLHVSVARRGALPRRATSGAAAAHCACQRCAGLTLWRIVLAFVHSAARIISTSGGLSWAAALARATHLSACVLRVFPSGFWAVRDFPPPLTSTGLAGTSAERKEGRALCR